jgi:hypothetical protein
MQQNTLFRFMSFKELVPDPLRFWIYIATVTLRAKLLRKITTAKFYRNWWRE